MQTSIRLTGFGEQTESQRGSFSMEAIDTRGLDDREY